MSPLATSLLALYPVGYKLNIIGSNTLVSL